MISYYFATRRNYSQLFGMFCDLSEFPSIILGNVDLHPTIPLCLPLPPPLHPRIEEKGCLSSAQKAPQMSCLTLETNMESDS